MKIDSIKKYIFFYYLNQDKNFLENTIEWKKLKDKIDVEKLKWPAKNSEELKKLLLKHVEMLFYTPYDINIDESIIESIALSDDLRYYLSPAVKQLWFFKNKLKIERISSVKRTGYGWVFRLKLDPDTYYLADEYFFFSPKEKALFIKLLDETSNFIRLLSSGDMRSKNIFVSMNTYERQKLKRYVFLAYLFNYLILPYLVKDKDFYLVDLKEGKDFILHDDKIEVSLDLAYFVRRLLLSFDFYQYYFGIFGHYLRDRESVEEVLVNYNNDFHEVMHGGKITSVSFIPRTNKEIKAYIEKMLRHRPQQLNRDTPIIQAELPTGDRTSFVDSSISENYSFNIRIFKQIPLSVMDFFFFGNFGIDLIAMMGIYNNISTTIFYSGGTGTGKTTALNAFIGLIPFNRFLIIVEDVKEMDPFHPPRHTRREVAPTEEFFDVLVKAALRHSPDSIVFQEIRTPKVMEAFLDAVNTGHAGSQSTFHASNIEELLQRIKGFNLDPELVKGLHCIYFIRRIEMGGTQIRRVSSVTEVADVRMEKDTGLNIITNHVFYLLRVTDGEKETLLPMQINLPKVINRVDEIKTNLINKHPGIDVSNPEDYIRLELIYSVYFKKLFNWIKKHPLWKGKYFEREEEILGEKRRIIVTLREFLPSVTTLFYQHLEEGRGTLKDRLAEFINDLDIVGNDVLEDAFMQRVNELTELEKQYQLAKKKSLEIIKTELIQYKSKKIYERIEKLLESWINLFDKYNVGDVIGSRVTEPIFMEKIEGVVSE